MLGVNLAFFVLLGQVPSAEPSALVARLGSPRYAEREQAAGDLERLGRRAIPALRIAREARDPEIRTRALALSNKIEGALLTEPTLVTLDFEDQPLPDVIKALSDRTEIKLGLAPENAQVWPGRRITLQESSPFPFWKAIDRLCEVAQVHYNLGMQGLPTSREPIFALLDGGPRGSGPTSDSGPFRVSLLSLHYQRDVAFSNAATTHMRRLAAPPPPPVPAGIDNVPRADGPTVHEQFYAQVQVAAEPRLSLNQNGPLRILEAVDDRGQSLLPELGDGAMTQRASGYYGVSAGSALQLHAPLKHPEQPGQLIRKLRGTLPILVSTRKPDPLVVPLQGAEGKSFQNDEVSFSVIEIRVNPAIRQTSIDVLLRSGPGTTSGFAPPLANGRDLTMIQRPNRHEQQIEVIDSQGHVMAWYPSSFDSEGTRMTLTLTPNEQAAPAEIRYFALARAATEVGFEFNDVPMP